LTLKPVLLIKSKTELSGEYTEKGLQSVTAVAVRKGIPHNHVDLPPLVSIEATRVCRPIGNSEVLIATVYKSLGRAWIDADIIEL
jgi:hypothetical protein